MTRWKVRKQAGTFWDENDDLRYGTRWRVASPTGVLWGSYDTRAEAMKNADKRASTVTVTLPRGVSKVRLGQNAWVELRADGGASVHGKGASTGIRKYKMEEVALALLAHARRNA